MPVKLISSFSGAYSFLSNFYSCKIEFEGKWYPSAEHAYQAAKTLDPKQRNVILNAGSPGQAKRLGQRVTLRPMWEETKLLIMEAILRAKFQHPVLRENLISTHPANLVEGNTWGDQYWGATRAADGSWNGMNALGIILMKLRKEIIEEEG